jgi:virginiamycin B lyase
MAGLVGVVPNLVASPVRLVMAGCAVMPGACLMLLASQVATIHTATPQLGTRPFATAERRWPYGITVGPDRNIWFVERGTWRIGRITLKGAITELPLPQGVYAVRHITAGPDGNMWFAARDGIGQMTPAGTVKLFPLPKDHTPLGITAGADGAIWFTDSGPGLTKFIGRLTLAGEITEIPLEQQGSINEVVVGPDKAIWFDMTSTIGRVGPTGSVTWFPLTHGGLIEGMCVGPDKNLWFTVAMLERRGDSIDRMTLDGRITRFPLSMDNNFPIGITAGPDGNLWFTENATGHIGTMTTTGQFMTFPLPHANSWPSYIVTGPDGNLWFTEENRDTIGRITPEGKITEFPIPGGIGDEP